MKILKSLLFVFCLLFAANAGAQTLSATEIVKRADDNRRGNSLYSEITMTKKTD